MNREYADVFNEKKQEEMRRHFCEVVGPKGEVEIYKKGVTIWKDMEDELYIVKAGRISVSFSDEEGGVQLLYYLAPGELLGDFEVLSGVRQSYLIHFPEECHVYKLKGARVREYLKENPEAYGYFIHSMTRKYNLALCQASYNRFYSGEERLVEFLLRIGRSRNSEGQDEVYIRGYTHEDIGNNINISRIAVNNILKKLKERDLIEVARKSIRVVSLDALTSYRDGLR